MLSLPLPFPTLQKLILTSLLGNTDKFKDTVAEMHCSLMCPVGVAVIPPPHRYCVQYMIAWKNKITAAKSFTLIDILLKPGCLELRSGLFPGIGWEVAALNLVMLSASTWAGVSEVSLPTLVCCLIVVGAIATNTQSGGKTRELGGRERECPDCSVCLLDSAPLKIYHSLCRWVRRCVPFVALACWCGPLSLARSPDTCGRCRDVGS